jgi:CRP-like cAMP-binding protein
MPLSTPPILDLFLKRLLRRSELDTRERQAILRLAGQVRQIPARRDFVSPGEVTDHACLVVDGLIARFDQMSDGRRQIVSFYVPGDMSDLQSVAAPTPGWGLEALSTTTVLFVPHAQLRQIALDHPRIGLAFWRDTTVDASILAKWVGNLGRRQAGPRVAHLICETGVRMEQAGLGTRTKFSLPATQAQLADATGLTPVHLNRTLKALRPEGLLVRGGTVRIADWDRLAAIAEFDPAYLLLDERRAEAA